MAKVKKTNVHEWGLFIVIVLLLLTNIIWYLAVQDINNRLDAHSFLIEQALKQ